MNPTTPTIEELNSLFQDYQEDLDIRDRHLKIPITFQDDSLDSILDILASVRPNLLDDPTPTPPQR